LKKKKGERGCKGMGMV